MHRKKLVVWASLISALGIAGACVIAYAGGLPANAEYVGVAKCKACHLKDYNTWRKTKHAMVFEQLQGAERKDAECLKCHTTGYNKPGGFVSEEKTEGMKNVGCEACHGPSSAHVAAAVDAPETGKWDTKINKVPQNTCVECHNPHINRKEQAEKLRAGNK